MTRNVTISIIELIKGSKMRAQEFGKSKSVESCRNLSKHVVADKKRKSSNTWKNDIMKTNNVPGALNEKEKST